MQTSLGLTASIYHKEHKSFWVNAYMLCHKPSPNLLLWYSTWWRVHDIISSLIRYSKLYICMSSVISASSVDIILTLMSHLSYSPLNPRRACAVKVTVVPCVCVCVCPLTTILALKATTRHMSDIKSVSSASA